MEGSEEEALKVNIQMRDLGERAKYIRNWQHKITDK